MWLADDDGKSIRVVASRESIDDTELDMPLQPLEEFSKDFFAFKFSSEVSESQVQWITAQKGSVVAAIETTPVLISDSILQTDLQTVSIETVDYVDAGPYTIVVSLCFEQEHGMAPLFCVQDNGFQFENSVVVAVQRVKSDDRSTDNIGDIEFLEVDTTKLIKAIVISPYLDDFIFGVVKREVITYLPNVSVLPSSLSQPKVV
jgi:hypothetical protein